MVVNFTIQYNAILIALVDNTGPTLGYTLIERNKNLNAADNNQDTTAGTTIMDPNPRVCAFECALRTDCVGFIHTPAGPDVCILLKEIPADFNDVKGSNVYIRTR